MWFKNVNIREELERERDIAPEDLITEAKAILLGDTKADEQLLRRLQGESAEKEALKIPLYSEDKSALFEEGTIRKVCTKYRLRFLDTQLFKGDIPYEALVAIKQMEKKYQVQFEEFRIVAPAPLFQLEDSTKDPLLFAVLGNGDYLLMHQWGSDLVWHRKLLLYPFRNISSLGLSIVLLSFLLTAFLPLEFPAPQTTVFVKFFLFSTLSCSLFVASIIFGILRYRDFSENVWESKYFN